MMHPTTYPVASGWSAGPSAHAVIAQPARMYHPAPQHQMAWHPAPRTGAPALATPASHTVSAAAGNPSYIAAVALLATVLIIGIPLACYLGLLAA